jgi:protein phosphatase 1 regulatory subunit 7
VQGLAEIGDVGRFENLEHLLLEDQIRLNGITVGPNPKLSDVRVLNCKTLETIAGIEDLKALSSLRIYKTAIDYERFLTRLHLGRLETFEFLTGKSKRDLEIRKDLEMRHS